MKKTILRTVVLLLCSFISIAGFGCSHYDSDVQSEESQTEASEELIGTPLENDSEQITALVSYLEQINLDREIADLSFESKIYQFRLGGRPLHVRLDPRVYYYVCGYYNEGHENEKDEYCCASEYIWIEYASEKDILEYYDGKILIAAFQINKPIEVVDILEAAIPPSFEHFQIYDPVFEDGVNIGKPGGLEEESFIYMNASDDPSIYHSVSSYSHSLVTVPCAYIDGQYYITLELDGSKSLEEFMSLEFGAYSEAFSAIVDTEKYSITDNQGQKHSYGIFEIGIFMKEVSKIVAKDRLLLQFKKDIEEDENGNIDITANMFLPIATISTSNISWFMQLHISNDNFYLYKNKVLFENVEIILNPDFGYPVVGSFVNKNQAHKYSVFNRIRYAQSCYYLTSSDLTVMPVAIYIVDGDYYIITISSKLYELYEMFEYKIGE